MDYVELFYDGELFRWERYTYDGHLVAISKMETADFGRAYDMAQVLNGGCKILVRQ